MTATEEAAVLLEVDDLSTTFSTRAGSIRAVDGVSLHLDRGETLGIVGESGSGKSVLVRSIMGLAVRDGAEHSGSVRLDDVELVDLPLARLRQVWGRDVAMVFQDPMTSLNPVVRVGRQITEVVRRHLHLSKQDAEAAAISLLTEVGIADAAARLRQYPSELSGGLRQRVVIAIALACNPRLLLADEPTTALDVTVQAQILDLLDAEQRDRGMAMVLVSHDLSVVAGRTDRVAVMYAGRVVEAGPTELLLGAPLMPYTEALLEATPDIDQRPHKPLRSIGGTPPDLASPPPGCRFASRCRYARDVCHESEPPLVPADRSDHLFRCWFPLQAGVVAPEPARAVAERAR